MAERDGILSLAEERRMLKLVRTGDRISREKIFLANRPLVYRLAHRYRHFGISMDDLVHEGFLGLLHAIDRFRPQRTTRLATYATWWIRFTIRRAIATMRGPICLPTPLLGSLHGLEQSRQQLMASLGREPTRQELAAHMHCPVTRVRTLEHVSGGTISPPEEWAAGQPTPLDLATKTSLHHALADGICQLTPLESRILRLRYGLDGADPLPLDAIAHRCRVGKHRVQLLAAGALKKLRAVL
ncbi:MAG: sigma-70 family RNA polymerase sigma factor [Puniceicoccales bacterium]|nr:sigma-70 family RNA polymerase sigma factor [Puniceicoccales bacterium]